MHNLSTVIRFEFIRTIKKKTFWLSLLAFPAIFIVVGGAMYLSNSVAEEASERNRDEGFSAQILDDSGLILPEVVESISASAASSKLQGIAAVRDQEVDAFIYYPADPSKQEIEVYAIDAGLMENEKYTAVAKELLRASASTVIDSPQLISIVRGDIQSNLTTYEDGQVAPGFERVIAPGIFLMLFYAIIVLLGNQMLTSTTEEKENRVIEMILTTVEARTLIIGKILALVLLGIVQVVVITAPAIVAYILAGDRLNLPAVDLGQLQIDPWSMLIGLGLFILSFLLFTGILVAIGAAVPTAKEANNFFGVAIFAMFIPLYAISAIISDPSQLIVQIFSYFPLTAPVTLMVRNAIGNLPGWEAAIGISILAVCSVIALAVATHTFRYGTLEYDRKLSWKEIFSFKA